MAKIIMPDGVQPFDLEDDIANDDALLRQALAVAYPDAKNAEFKRETRDGLLSVRVIKKAGTKGGVLADLVAAPEAINPAIRMERELVELERGRRLDHLTLIGMRGRIASAVEAGEREVRDSRQALRTLREAPAAAGSHVPRGF